MTGMPAPKTEGTLSATPVKTEFTMDDGPSRYRIGLIALANDFATERDFMNMRPGDDVAVFVSRVLNDNVCDVAQLREMAPKLAESASLILPGSRLDSIAYSCTSGTVVIGQEEIAASVNSTKPDVPVVTPITASLTAFGLFGVKKLSVLTPYIDDVNAPIVQYIRDHGFDVVDLTSFLVAEGNDMARIPPEAIFEAALEADRPDAEALFISCTAIRAVDVVEKIEHTLGKPVVTANQALFWHALREAGYPDPIQGYGKLLRLQQGRD